MADDQSELILKTTRVVRFLKKLLTRIPPLFFVVFWIRYRMQIFGAKQLVIVTTPGHVGSSTVFNSLKTIQWPARTRVYDIHSLRERFNNNSPVHSISARHVLQEVLRGMVLRKALRKKKVTVISIVRDPVARALGGMFQNSDVFIKGVEVNQISQEHFDNGCQKIRTRLVDDGLLATTAAWQLSFYKTELSEYWGFSVEQLVMNKSVGILENGSHTLIILTLEDLSETFGEVVQAQFGARANFVMANSNTSDFYAFCKQSLKVDKAILQPFYADPFFERVYGKERIESMMMRWSKEPL